MVGYSLWGSKICQNDRYFFFFLAPCGKESTCNAGDLASIPGLGRSPGEGNGNPLQYSCLENPMDRGAWQATVRGVSMSQTQLSDFHFHVQFLLSHTVIWESKLYKCSQWAPLLFLPCIFIYFFVYFWLCRVFLAVCWLSLVAASGYFLVVARRLLTVVASLVDHRL